MTTHGSNITEPLITVALPTYNRPDFLDFFLKTHVDLFNRFNVKICISNNGCNEQSQIILQSWKSHYNHLQYTATSTVVSSDENISKVLSMSDTEFTWLIGDSYEITEDALNKVLVELNANKDVDFLIVNLVDRYHHNTRKIYNDPNHVITELGIIIACISCNIFKTSRLDISLMKKYWGTDFSILGYSLDFIANNEFKLTYLEDASVVTLKTPQRKVGWPHRFFEIMFINWIKFVDELPNNYSIQDKEHLKVMLIEKSGICNWRNILNVRGTGWLNHTSFKQHQNLIKKYSSKYLYLYMNTLRFVPCFLCVYALFIIEKYRRYRYLIGSKVFK